MNRTHLVLNCLKNTIQNYRSCINDASDAASGASLRNHLALVHRELDSIEAELITRAASIELHFDELPSVSHFLFKIRNRITLHFKGSDSSVAESLIRCSTDNIIHMTRIMNSLGQTEIATELLYHRLLGCLSASIRSFQSYL